MFGARGRTLACLALALAGWLSPARAFSPDEEKLIRFYAQDLGGLENADAALAPGMLSATTRTLPPLLRACEAPEVERGLAWLLERKLLPEASLSYLLRQDHEACGPYRHVTRTLFRPGSCIATTPFFLYRPETGEYTLGGLMVPGTALDVLVRREDAVYGCTLPDGRVVFVPERAVRLGVAPAPSPLPEQVLEHQIRDAYSYSAVRVDQSLVHVVRIDLAQLSMSTAVSPFFNTLQHGPERTQPVEGMARKFGARVAINGTFFVDDPAHSNYGFPIGSFMIGGRVAWSLANTQLLRFERSYAAFTDDGRLVLGHTALTGDQIRASNLSHQFDPQRIGQARILALGTGFGWLIRDKKADAWRGYAGKQFDASFYSVNSHRARSLLGVDPSGRQAYLVALEEGPNSPHPMSMPELAEWIAARARIQDMVFLDGGGSTQLVLEGKNVSAPPYRKNSSAVLFLPK